MNPTLTSIVDLRYADDMTRLSFLKTIGDRLKGDANYSTLAAIIGSDGNRKNLVLIAVFAVWLDEVSYAWDKNQRNLQVEELKSTAVQLSVDYEAISASRIYSETIKDWLEKNLLP